MKVAHVMPKGTTRVGRRQKTLYRVCNSGGEILRNQSNQAIDGKGTHLQNLAQQKADDINEYYTKIYNE